MSLQIDGFNNFSTQTYENMKRFYLLYGGIFWSYNSRAAAYVQMTPKKNVRLSNKRKSLFIQD